MDTDSLYLALSEEKLEDVILPEKRAEWDQLRSKDCSDNFTANATDNFFPRTCCNAHNKHDKRYLKKKSVFQKQSSSSPKTNFCEEMFFEKSNSLHDFWILIKKFDIF